MGETAEIKKAEKKQDATLGRKTQVAIWTALIAAAGTFFSTGLPDIVRLFSSRPSLEVVQDMIADQADKLTVVTNRNVETLKKQQEALRVLTDIITKQREELARLQGCAEMTRNVVRDCCTRRIQNLEERLKKKVEAAMGPSEPPPKSLMKATVHGRKFEKVPKMERLWQQQVQMQEE